jgi:hypothetical protein
MPAALALPPVGTVFPDLELVDAEGNLGRLADLVDGRAAVVHFMRSSTCPVCLGHAAVLEKMRATGDIPDVELVFIAPGGAAEAAEAGARLRGRRIQVRASGDAHASLGLGRFLALQHSGTVVLDPERAVLSAVSAAIPVASFSRAETIAALRA